MVEIVLNFTEKGKIRSKIANILNLIAWTHRRTASKEQCSEHTKKVQSGAVRNGITPNVLRRTLNYIVEGSSGIANH